MGAALIMIWLGTAASQRAHQADLDGWAAARQRRLSPPSAEPELPPASHDDAAADHIESVLAEARTLAYSGDRAGALSLLERADSDLKKRLDLPEFAWLEAEVLHELAIACAPDDAGAAAAYERRSVALGGPRAAPFSAAKPETASRKSGPAFPGEEVPPVAATGAASTLDGPLSSDDVYIDGVRVSEPRTVPYGAHHVRVLRGGRLAWAGLVENTGDPVHVGVQLPTPCSTEDLAEGNAVVLCPDYVRARDAGPQRIEVTRCHQGHCEVWLPWSRGWGATLEGPMQPVRKPHTAPAWFLWTAAGVAAVIVGGVVAAEEGAFERRGPTRETFTFVGPK